MRLGLTLFILLLMLVKASLAQTYPVRSARIIVPWTAGGTADLLARLTGQKLSSALGQPFVADNRPGAGGLIGTDIVAKAPADGYTLLLGTTAPNSVAPSLYKKIPFDPLKDFSYISLLASTCYVLSVHPSLPANDVKALIRLAKTRNGSMNFSSPGIGTPNHLSGEMFKMHTGLDLQHVAYKGSAQAIGDVISGQITMSFENIVVASTFVTSGRIRALAVTSAQRAPILPTVPTVAESGIRGFEAIGWFGLLAPAGMPKDLLTQLNMETIRALKSDDLSDRIRQLGAVLLPTSPEAFDQFNRQQVSLWAKVVKASGAVVE